GLPGENPTLMFGTVFYEGEFEDPKDSLKEAEELVKKQNELSKRIHVPAIPDIFIYEEDEVEWKIDFALDRIHGYFSLDMPESDVRVKALEYLHEKDALDKVIFNSINIGISEEEIVTLKRCTPRSAVVLAFNPKSKSVQGRLDIIKDGGQLLKEGLLETAKNAGIENVLLDTAAQPFKEGASETLRAIPVFKSEFGLPVGCAMHNTVESWNWLGDQKKKVFDTVDTSINDLPILLGGDFVYYGPIENAETQLTNMAMVDKLVAEGAEEYFGVDVDQEHPYNHL
ncbi:MAG: hypothetical protein ACOC53_02905, partial [Candidatus Saliniplasma sp.]